ncbi:MAG: hypothetical protein ACHQ2Z_05280 [Elusimicrobiota bacterium]
MKTLNKSFVVEAALAALFAAAAVLPAVAQDAAPKGGDQPMPVKKAPSKKAAGKVHCFGINSCKGKSECAVEGKSGCTGKNECKGQGWISVSSAKKCTAKKGTVVGAKPAAAPATPAAPAAK